MNNRILHIIPDYLHNPLYDCLLTELEKIGVHNRVFVCDNLSHKTINNHKREVFVYNRSFNELLRAMYFPKQNALFHFALDNEVTKDIQLIHAHTLFSSGYLAYRLHKKFNIPYIVAIRNTDLNVFMKYMPWLRPLAKRIMDAAQRVIFISPAYKRQFDLDNSVTIPNGIDRFYLSHIHRHQQNTDNIRLLFVGTLQHQKNIETIIAVADELNHRNERVSLTLIGAIKDKHYKRLIESKQYVHYHPHIPKEELIHYYRNNDIFIMPSFTETFGLTYAEALSQGLPVIYTKGQGFDGHFEDGQVGFAVPPSDVNYIIDKIYSIRTDYDAISQQCNQAVQRFDWETIAVNYKHIYNND